ncbi:MAG: twin-arginine translocation signal domain-containing protein [Alphaproteobacteria bacterium]|nr:twin-arginine translocation signal domain-containing protein [Alphaproteobacteria bacterium]
MLRKKTAGTAPAAKLASALTGPAGQTVDRRSFLKRSGLAAGGIAAAAAGAKLAMVEPAQAAGPIAVTGEVKKVISICTHCSVGCAITAEVQNGVWIGQEPTFDSPLNLGAHCAKGASVREHAHGERRLKYPMKLENGQWKRMSWDATIAELGDKLLKIRESAGADAVFWLGSAKHSNEQAYLIRKFAAFWGTNNVDHQARICHSTTVAGVANTWGYGAMTNSYNDMHNSRLIFMIGSNAAEAHPVAMMHILKAKEQNGAPLIVCDPRFTRTAAHANEYVRFRPGTDVALIWGIMWHIFENGWEDKDYLKSRVWGMDQVKAHVKQWTPEVVEDVTGVPGAQLKRVARLMATNKPGTLVWCMGGTQHHIGNNNVRAYCNLQLVLGNIGVEGGGANIFRGHDNVQGATDFGVTSDSLPGYYGLVEGSWRHWGRVWDVNYDYLLGRFKDKALMERTGIPVSRWFDGVLEDKTKMGQPENIKAMVFWGHAPNSQVRLPDMKRAMEKLDLLVVIDPYPTMSAVMSERKNDTWLLPAATQYETSGSVTASNRSLQWRDKIHEPVFECLPDHTIMYKFAKKFGFEKEMFKNIKITKDEPLVEDITREFNRGMWTIGYTGQSPERLKLHMANMATFDKTTLRANGGPCNGETFGLPWPCWGSPEFKHPGTHVLYDTSKTVMQGGLNFRANFGIERNGETLLAEGSYSKDAELKDGYPEFTMAMLKKLGWDKDLTANELEWIAKGGGDNANWKTDLSGGMQRVIIQHGCAPFGNAKARAVVWNFPDPVPLHREALYTPRRDLVAKYPTYKDVAQAWRLPTLYESIQKRDVSKDFPIILTSGRLVEYEGGGDETRSNPWLAELQQDMFVEINPFDANNLGVRNGAFCWVEGPENNARVKVKAMVTERVGKGVAFMPFHFAGWWMGQNLRSKYPKGADPFVLGEAANTATTYGYDSVTQMQETKTTVCRIRAA